MKVIIIEQGKAPYFKDIDLEKYNDNMNTYAEAEIGCDYIDRVQILPNYELTIYVDDLNSRRDDSELNFFVKGVQYDLPVKGKAVVSRGEVYLDEIEYQDTTKEDLKLLNQLLIFPNELKPFKDLECEQGIVNTECEQNIFYHEISPESFVFIKHKFHRLSKVEKRKFLENAETEFLGLDDIVEFNRFVIGSEDDDYDVKEDRNWWKRVFEIAVNEWRESYPKSKEF